MKNKTAIFIIAFVVLVFAFKVGKSINIAETSSQMFTSPASTEVVKYQPDSKTLSRLASLLFIATCVVASSYLSSRKKKTALNTSKSNAGEYSLTSLQNRKVVATQKNIAI
jgi:uncharacterized membrane protein YjgN (DUF898 family)